MAILQKALAIVIAGPTASGKSHLALELAQAFNGVIINADSVQLYENLSILSAQPTPDDFCKATHRLYGILPGEKKLYRSIVVRDGQRYIGRMSPKQETASYYRGERAFI